MLTSQGTFSDVSETGFRSEQGVSPKGLPDATPVSPPLPHSLLARILFPCDRATMTKLGLHAVCFPAQLFNFLPSENPEEMDQPIVLHGGNPSTGKHGGNPSTGKQRWKEQFETSLNYKDNVTGPCLAQKITKGGREGGKEEGRRKERDTLIHQHTDPSHLDLEHTLCPGHFPLPTPRERRECLTH